MLGVITLFWLVIVSVAFWVMSFRSHFHSDIFSRQHTYWTRSTIVVVQCEAESSDGQLAVTWKTTTLIREPSLDLNSQARHEFDPGTVDRFSTGPNDGPPYGKGMYRRLSLGFGYTSVYSPPDSFGNSEKLSLYASPYWTLALCMDVFCLYAVYLIAKKYRFRKHVGFPINGEDLK
jgi:hypothetical protein